MATALSEPRIVSELIVEDAAPVPYRSVGEFKVTLLYSLQYRLHYILF